LGPEISLLVAGSPVNVRIAAKSDVCFYYIKSCLCHMFLMYLPQMDYRICISPNFFRILRLALKVGVH